jgi:hypothetical protein
VVSFAAEQKQAAQSDEYSDSLKAARGKQKPEIPGKAVPVQERPFLLVNTLC